MDGEIFFNGLFIRAFQLVKFRGNCLLDRALLLALASCKQQGSSSFLIWVSRVLWSTRAGTTPCLDTQKPAAYVAIRMDFSREYPSIRKEARAEIKASAPPVVSMEMKSAAGKYFALSSVFR